MHKQNRRISRRLLELKTETSETGIFVQSYAPMIRTMLAHCSESDIFEELTFREPVGFNPLLLPSSFNTAGLISSDLLVYALCDCDGACIFKLVI